jgi:hypothetical protein
MIYGITCTKDGYTSLTLTECGETNVMKYALMRESQGYVVDIDTYVDESPNNLRLVLRRTASTV